MCIIVTDRDGTPVISVKADTCTEIGLATKPAFLATYTMATDQASKLGLGKNQSVVCMYSNYHVRNPLLKLLSEHLIKKTKTIHFYFRILK